MKQKTSKTVNERRDFLRQVATGAAAVSLGMLASPVPLAAVPVPHGLNDDDPDAWFNKLTGKHKIVYDVVKPNGIMPFAWSRVFLITNGMTGTPARESNVVVILRHDAIPYAMEDRLWKKYNFGEMFKITDEATKAPVNHNAFWQPKPGDFKIPGIGEVAIGINQLQDDGVMFAVCNMALTVFSAAAAQKMNMSAEEVKKDWVAGVLPGIQIVPSGVWAVGRAQEHGCGYCYAG